MHKLDRRAPHLVLPAPGTRSPFERPDDIRGNPAAVEVAFLGLYLLVTQVAGVYPTGVKSQVAVDGG